MPAGSSEQQTTTTVLHVAPSPDGGWRVAADAGRIMPSEYADFAEAVSEAQAYAASHPGFRVHVDDPVA